MLAGKMSPLMRFITMLLAVGAAVVFAAPDCAAAGPEQKKTRAATDATRAVKATLLRFEQLAERDAGVSNVVAWERLGTELQDAAKDLPRGELQARTFLALARLYEQTFRVRTFRPGLAKATYFYERLAREYQGAPFVPDALLKLADLRREGLKDEVAERAAYFEIVDLYPGTREAAEARSRLGMDDGGAPVADPEPPRSSSAKGSLVDSLFGSREESKEIVKASPSVSRPTIVIDPGHGGEELGAQGADGVLEKDVVLQIAILLDELLRDRLRANTVLTRKADVTLPLSDRTKIANANNADLFISIHANASEYRTAKGIETYYLDNTNEKSSLKLAERENASLGGPRDDISFIISDFIQSAKQEESISFAHYVQRSLIEVLGRYYDGVKDLGVKRAPFYVLVGAHMPCILAEVSFIDHPVEGQRLASRRYQRLIALALYQGIREYFSQHGK